MSITVKKLGVALPGDPNIEHRKCYIATTVAEMDTIVSPLANFVCFCEETSRFYAFVSSRWVPLALQAESMIELRTSDPTSPVEGQMWLRTDL